MVRGGESNRLVDAFIDGGYIGVGYPQVPDGTTVSRTEVIDLLSEDGRTVPEQRAARFESFVQEMQVDDIVLMPDTPRGDMVIGVIAGDYGYQETIDPDHYRHRRPVTWLGREPIAALPDTHAHFFKLRQTLTEADAAGIEPFVHAALDGTPSKAATDRAPAKPPSRSGLAERERRRTEQLCLSCGLLKNKAQFGPGDTLCSDCR